MRTLNKTLLAAAALVAITLCATSTGALRAAAQVAADGRQFYGVGDLMGFEGVNVESREGEITGMSVLGKDGRWLDLQQQSSPTCATSCAEGEKLSCWEDHEQQMSVCVCVSPGGSGVLRRGGTVKLRSADPRDTP